MRRDLDIPHRTVPVPAETEFDSNTDIHTERIQTINRTNVALANHERGGVHLLFQRSNCNVPSLSG